MKILVDTNVILRRIHRSHPQHRVARTSIGALNDQGDLLCVANQNLIECWAVCTRPIDANGLGLSPAATTRILGRIEAAVVRLNDEQDGVYMEWKRLVALNSVSGKNVHDARLVAVMKVHGLTHVLTFNASDFKRFDGITTIAPNDLVVRE